MTKLILVLAGTTLAMTLPAAAQVGVDAGPGGVGVHLGDRPHRDYDRDRYYYRYRDRDDYRDRDEFREQRHVRACDTFWRHGERVTVCHRD